MELREVQVCESTQPWHTEYVLSHSRFGQIYQVLVPDPDDDPAEWICSCEGFHYRGYCSHQLEASAKVCLWTEIKGPRQTPEQQAEMICPKCGGSTLLMTEVI